MDEETLSCALLAEFPSLGFKRIQRILPSLQNIASFIHHPERILDYPEVPASIKAGWIHHCRNQDLMRHYFQNLAGDGLHFYPFWMLSKIIPSQCIPPVCLKGNFQLGLLSQYPKKIAVIGTSNPDSSGRHQTEELIHKIARKEKALIVSGFAKGIDQTAHHSALSTGLDTLAFLPFGIEKIDQKWSSRSHFYYLSETPVASGWESRWAILRNRLIAAFCDVLIVVQSMPDGGSFHTVRFANDYGKSVFALQSAGDQFEGNAVLIERNWAKAYKV